MVSKIVALCAMLVLAAPAFSQTQPTVDLTISPETAVGSGPVNITLSWTSTDAIACRASGAWSGDKPANGTEVISNVTASKLTFHISCRAARGPFGITWTAPTQRQDGTPGVAVSFNIHEATTAAGVPGSTPLTVPGNILSYVLWLPSGVHYVRVAGVDSDGVPGVLSNVVSKTVYALAGTDTAVFSRISRLQAPSLQLSN